MRRLFMVGVVIVAVLSGFAVGSGSDAARLVSSAACKKGSVAAVIRGKRVCLKVGQSCKRSLDGRYHRYGFHCHATGRLTRPKPAPRYVTLSITGPPQVVFDWTNDRCEDLDIPDAPARAFRGADGRVQLIAAHFINRRSVGPDLNHLSHECSVVLASHFDPDPAAFADSEWIGSTYTNDGQTIYALLHDEYHGWEHPGQCPSSQSWYTPACLYNAITLAVSTDGGATYFDQPQPHVVASAPYRYVPDRGPLGIFTPSNIVHNAADNYYYALVYLNLSGPRVGTCLIRTRNLADPTSWRGWSGGRSFDTSFIDPYRSLDDPNAHLCTLLQHAGPGDMQPGSITYSTVARQWLWVGQAIDGAYVSLSPDLINWSPPVLFFPAQVTWDYQCGDRDPIAYPSLIDPASTSRNFETVGGKPYLYYTLFHYTNCGQTLDRDLVRIPITISP
ncbi:MAG: hypothetical protein EXQ81_06340 [Thermoleophilia bacterium]|nr:hypothetical protein [Thermoleophilia bacterium]